MLTIITELIHRDILRFYISSRARTFVDLEISLFGISGQHHQLILDGIWVYCSGRRAVVPPFGLTFSLLWVCLDILRYLPLECYGRLYILQTFRHPSDVNERQHVAAARRTSTSYTNCSTYKHLHHHQIGTPAQSTRHTTIPQLSTLACSTPAAPSTPLVDQI